MKAKEIREMSLKDLEERIETEKQNLSVMKMNHVISPLDNTSVIAKSRRDIARMITILEQRKKTEADNLVGIKPPIFGRVAKIGFPGRSTYLHRCRKCRSRRDPERPARRSRSRACPRHSGAAGGPGDAAGLRLCPLL